MKKWVKNVIITIICLGVISFVFWKINWISSWKEVAILYGILAVVIVISTFITFIKSKENII